MTTEPKLSHTAALILHAIQAGDGYGFSVMEITGLPSGTVYPALRRLEDAGYLLSKWETERAAYAQNRPRRKYYELTRAGREALAAASASRPARVSS